MKKEMLFCQECNLDVKVKYIKEKTVSNINGESITIDMEVPYCEKCGKELSDLELEDARYDLIYTEYRKKKGLLQPYEIKTIREKYELSQRAFSRVLGFAESTINRYELGAIQDNTNNLLIKLAKEPENMILLLEQNKKNLNSLEISKLSEKINQLLKGKADGSETEDTKLNIILKKVCENEKKLDFINRKLDIVTRKIDVSSMNNDKYGLSNISRKKNNDSWSMILS